MRSNRRSVRRHGNDGSFWISFSDLMSSIVVIIILVMFYIIYQYFNMLEVSEAKIARQQYDLDLAQTEMEEQQTKLTAAEEEMIRQQVLLDAKQAELDDAQAILESQRTELAETQATLTEKEAEIAAQQTQLDNQQAQIEDLVGLRTRIITSLSDALRENDISATVDAATGSITLESDVLFESGAYKMSDSGKAFIDEFLPIYLDVLFSDEYKDSVSEIIIEGHTDPNGTYIENLELSQQRALTVATYVLRDANTSITYAQKSMLRSVVSVNGRSFSDPVYYEGTNTVDYEASRRVVFKFRLTDERMIEQLREILESGDTNSTLTVESETAQTSD